MHAANVFLVFPMCWQSEERTLWQVPNVYMTMSPFLAADRIKTPILLVHGKDDNNTGTFPMQVRSNESKILLRQDACNHKCLVFRDVCCDLPVSISILISLSCWWS